MTEKTTLEPAPNVSKRGALRLSGLNRPLDYKTEFEEGTARLLDISTEGCAIHEASEELSVGEKILLSFTLEDPEKIIELQAVVVRTIENGYGLRFRCIEEHMKHRILLFFTRENRLHHRAGTTCD